MATLYVVGTPIGNLEDLTPRAARVLGQVDLIAAEDTRVTRRLLAHLGIRTTLVSYNENNRRERLPTLLAALASGDVALVTDAGMPGISDPGTELVAKAAEEGAAVEAVPGPSAVTTAIAVSGLPGNDFLFLGFLPRKRRERLARLRDQAGSPHTLVIFEAPHRVLAALADIAEALGDRRISVCRELTKLHEEVFRGTVREAIAHFPSPKGEFVLVVQGNPEPSGPGGPDTAQATAARERLAELRALGTTPKDAVSQVSAGFGLPRNTVYRWWIDLDRPSRQ